MSETNEKTIRIKVEPMNSEIKLGVPMDSTVEDVIKTVVKHCEDKGIDVAKWGAEKTGSSDIAFTVLRKAHGGVAMAPTVMFEEFYPPLEEDETFTLEARAQVG